MSEHALLMAALEELAALCRSNLALTASPAQLIPLPEARSDGTAELETRLFLSFNGVLHKVAGQLPILGISHRIFFGITDIAPDLGAPPESDLSLRPDASALTDRLCADTSSNVFYILFNIQFIREVFLTFDEFRHSLDPLLAAEPSIATVRGEQPITNEDRFTTACGMSLAALALEFAFYHELSHVLCGHLSDLYLGHQRLSMYAVGYERTQQSTLARKKKIYEIDADLTALVSVMTNLRESRSLLVNWNAETTSMSSKFAMLGFAVTVLFRLIEAWRREVAPVYGLEADHPHPDVRDGCIAAYIKQNASPYGREEDHLHDAYERGRMAAIEVISRIGTIPTFEVTRECGQDVAYREVGDLTEAVTALRRSGVCETDFRRLARHLASVAP